MDRPHCILFLPTSFNVSMACIRTMRRVRLLGRKCCTHVPTWQNIFTSLASPADFSLRPLHQTQVPCISAHYVQSGIPYKFSISQRTTTLCVHCTFEHWCRDVPSTLGQHMLGVWYLVCCNGSICLDICFASCCGQRRDEPSLQAGFSILIS